jgi:hypothetical protein
MNFKLKHQAKINSLEPGNTSNSMNSSPGDETKSQDKSTNSVDAKISSNPFVSQKVKDLRKETKFLREKTGPKEVEHSGLSDYQKQVQSHKRGFSVTREEGSTGLTYTKRNGSGSMTTSQAEGSRSAMTGDTGRKIGQERTTTTDPETGKPITLHNVRFGKEIPTYTTSKASDTPVKKKRK